MAALRELLAEFTIVFDRAGEMLRGNQAVDNLKAKLTDLQGAVAKPIVLPKIQAPPMPNLPAKAGAFASFKEGFNESQGLAGFTSKINAFRLGLAGLAGGFAVKGLVSIVDHIGDINESAQRLGVSIGDFQRLDVLAKQSGTSVGSLGTAFRTLANVAVDPTKESAEAFAKLGVETKNVDGTFKSRNDLFFETAGALADIGDGTVRAQMAQKLYGRGATELLPLLANGRAALEAQRDELAKLPVLTDETVKAADELSDSWKTLAPQLMAAAGPLITKLLIPGLRLATDLLLKLSKAVSAFSKDLSPANILLAGLALKLSSLIGPITGNATAMLKWAGSSAKVVLQFAKLAAAFLLIEDFIGFFQGKESVIGELLEKAFGGAAVEGTRKALHDIVDVIKELLGLLSGEGVGKKTRQIGDELSQFTSIAGGEVASKFGIGAGGTQGLGAKPAAAADFEQWVNESADKIGAFFNGTNIPAPGGPAQGGAVGAPNNVTVGDTIVQVSGVDVNNQGAVAGAVSRTLTRGRDAIIAPYLPAGGS